MATMDWQQFFTLPLPELPGDLVDLCPSRGGVPGMTLPRATAIRKLTILTLWPAVQGDREREHALLVCCNAHEQANWWVRAGTVGAPRSIADQLGWLLALRA